MSPIEFHRYQDARADTIIYKFDPDAAKYPHGNSECPITVYHHYRVEYSSKVLYHSDLVPLDLAMERWKKEKLPGAGMIMYAEYTKDPGTGEVVKSQYVWKGWEFGDGWEAGWIKVCGRTTDS
jgi:hypothetical protein